ncbi:hypothetical protein [Nocardia australiensis]|uniref:hypothetical protein n=1 Tax=Nocardia australiensis TaxID=2887191 RepID=UPI001D13C242|nr:hypothetical protein [Nocardia australiensis]
MAIGGLLLFVSTGGARLSCTRTERGLLLLGAIAVAGYPLSFYPAITYVGVAVATVITLGSAPVSAGLLAWLTGHGRPSTRGLGAPLAEAGVATLLAVVVLGERLPLVCWCEMAPIRLCPFGIR